MQYKKLIVYPCANGSLVSASYQNGSIIIFDKSGSAMGHIDAVPVVRCKDCKKFGNEEECPMLSMQAYTEEDDYCSIGERRPT